MARVLDPTLLSLYSLLGGYALACRALVNDSSQATAITVGLLGGALLAALLYQARRRMLAAGRGWHTWFGLHLLFGLVLVGAIPLSLPGWVYSQDQQLQIRALGEPGPESQGNEVWVLRLQINDSSIPVTSLNPTGEAESSWTLRDGKLLAATPNPEDVLQWTGRGVRTASLDLYSHPWSGQVEVTWNGTSTVHDLYASEARTRTIELPVATAAGTLPTLHALAMVLGHASLLATLLLLVQFVLVGGTPAPVSWLGYAALLAIIWSVMLGAFWPGILSLDSINQWRQFANNAYSDGHPISHTLLMRFLTQSQSPAPMAIAQIVLLSLVVGWVLGLFRQAGWSRGGTTALALVFACMPANAALVITLWKDVWFAGAMLLYSGCALVIVGSDGVRLQRWSTLLLLFASVCLAALTRHNGLPILIASLVVLGLAYWRSAWRVALVGALSIALVWGVRGPLYQAVGGQAMPVQQWWAWPVLHHLVAHVADGTPFSEEDQQLLDTIRPDGEWSYDPHRISIFLEGVDRQQVQDLGPQLLGTWWRATTTRPLTTARHVYWQSSLVWRIQHPPDSFASVVHIYQRDNELVTIHDNEFDLQRAPLLPGLTQPLADGIMRSTRSDWIWLLWRPALWLHLLLWSTLGVVFARRDWRWLLPIVPVVLNSLLIAGMAPAQEFRYQYPAYVIGMLLGPFMLYCMATTLREDDEGGTPETE